MVRIAGVKQTYVFLVLGSVEASAVVEALEFVGTRPARDVAVVVRAAGTGVTLVLSMAQQRATIDAIEKWSWDTSEDNVPGRIQHALDVRKALMDASPVHES